MSIMDLQQKMRQGLATNNNRKAKIRLSNNSFKSINYIFGNKAQSLQGLFDIPLQYHISMMISDYSINKSN